MTDKFPVGTRVRVIIPGNVHDGSLGTVVEKCSCDDASCVHVQGNGLPWLLVRYDEPLNKSVFGTHAQVVMFLKAKAHEQLMYEYPTIEEVNIP